MEVGDMLCELGLSHLIKDFDTHGVDLHMLKSIEREDFLVLVPQMGARLKIKQWIETRMNSNTTMLHQNEGPVHPDCASSEMEPPSINLVEMDDNSFTIVENIVIDGPSCLNGVNDGANDQVVDLHETSDMEIEDLNVTAEENLEPNQVGSLRRFFLQNQTLLEFIKYHSKTLAVFENFKSQKQLSSTDRTRLVSAVIDGVLDRHNSVNKKMLEELANNICEIFHNESKSTYYLFDKKVSKNAHGKLVYRYHNEKSRRNKLCKSNKIIVSDAPDKNTLQMSEDTQNKVKWLKYSCEPWSQVIQYWMSTHNCRKLQAEDDSPLHQFIAMWPILQNPNGHTLVSFHPQDVHNSNRLVNFY